MRFFLFLALVSFHLFAAAPIGKMVAVQGSVVAKGPSAERVLFENSEIFTKETVIVALDALAQIQFTDGGIVNLIGGTEYRVNNYNYKKIFQKDESSSELLKGGIRALSGSIAKANPSAYEIKTPTATIGLRGTILEARLQNGALYVGVETGRVEVVNMAGSVTIGAGLPNQYVLIPDRDIQPEFLMQRPLELDRNLFTPPPGGLSIDQVHADQTTPRPASRAPRRTAPTTRKQPLAPQVGDTPKETEGRRPVQTGGGASIQSGC